MSWARTGNYIETMAFIAKDAVLTVDDYVAQGSAQDRARLQQQAERVFRGAGNRSGRGRLRADASARPTRYAPPGPKMGRGRARPVQRFPHAHTNSSSTNS